MKKFVFIFFLLILFACEKSSQQVQIVRIETEDYKKVLIELINSRNFYAVDKNSDKSFFSKDSKIILPIHNSTSEKELVFSSFKIFESESNKLLGSLTFQHIPKNLFNNDQPILSLYNCSIALPTKKDDIKSTKRPAIKKADYHKLLKKINSWDPSALNILLSEESKVIEKCSLIIQFIWSSSPEINYPLPYVDNLTLIERLEGLENKEFSLLCGGIGNLFVEISSALMPDVKLRHINGFECDYSKVYRKIHVNSHIFIEIFDKDHWIYIDPYFQLYFTDHSGNLLGVKEIRKMIKLNRLDQLVPNHFPANIPKAFFNDNGEYDIRETITTWGLFKCFNWIRSRLIE